MTGWKVIERWFGFDAFGGAVKGLLLGTWDDDGIDKLPSPPNLCLSSPVIHMAVSHKPASKGSSVSQPFHCGNRLQVVNIPSPSPFNHELPP